MRKLITICVVVLAATTLFGQSPEMMNYQAVIRNANGLLVQSQEIGMQVSILQGAADGMAVYVESHTAETNINGLVTIEIGTGISSGEFSSIDWANGPYFIKTETDPEGGTNYSVTGISQLLSVPYALHATSAEYAETAQTVSEPPAETDPVFGASLAAGLTANDTASWNGKQDPLIAGPGIHINGDTIRSSVDTIIAGPGIQINGDTISSSIDPDHFYLGQDTLGGIVFYIYRDRNGAQHGLIVSKTETSAQWQSTPSLTQADRSWDGTYNTGLITGSPAVDWVKGLGEDWYLPSIDELSLLWNNRYHANQGLNAAGGALLSNSAYYWSSTEGNATYAFPYTFYGGFGSYRVKTTTYNVRAVKAF